MTEAEMLQLLATGLDAEEVCCAFFDPGPWFASTQISHREAA